MFDELLRQAGVEEHVELRSTFGFMAFHGGSLEKGTDEIATASAAASGASLYTVIQPPDLRWHVPSKAFDPACSPALATFLAHVDTVITIHGYGREGRFTTVMLGGRNRGLAGHVAAHLRPALPEYTVVDDLDDMPAELRGLHADNPVNRPRSTGVQVELPPHVRGLGPFWADRTEPGRVPHTDALIDGLAAAARSWPGSPLA